MHLGSHRLFLEPWAAWQLWGLTEGEEVGGRGRGEKRCKEKEGTQGILHQNQWHKKHCPDLMALKSCLPLVPEAADAWLGRNTHTKTHNTRTHACTHIGPHTSARPCQALCYQPRAEVIQIQLCHHRRWVMKTESFLHDTTYSLFFQ